MKEDTFLRTDWLGSKFEKYSAGPGTSAILNTTHQLNQRLFDLHSGFFSFENENLCVGVNFSSYQPGPGDFGSADWIWLSLFSTITLRNASLETPNELLLVVFAELLLGLFNSFP